MSVSRFLRLDVVRNPLTEQWIWRLFATNGRELCRSSQDYVDRGNCDHSARLAFDLHPYSGSRILQDGETFSSKIGSGRPPIRVRVLP